MTSSEGSPEKVGSIEGPLICVFEESYFVGVNI